MIKSLLISAGLLGSMLSAVRGQDAFKVYGRAVEQMVYGNVAYTYQMNASCWNEDLSARNMLTSKGEYIRMGRSFYHYGTGVTTVYDGTYMLNIADKDKTILLEKFQDFNDPTMLSRFIDSGRMEIAAEVKRLQDSSLQLFFRAKAQTGKGSIVESAELIIGKDYHIRQVNLKFKKEVKGMFSKPCSEVTIKYMQTPEGEIAKEKLLLSSYVQINNDKASGVGKYKSYKIVSTLNAGYESN